jgi:hypothetical protein
MVRGRVSWTVTSIYQLMPLLQLVRQAYQSLSLHAAEDAISTNNSSKGGTFSSEHKTRVRFWIAMVDGSAYENRKGPCLERIEGSDGLDSHPRADAIQGSTQTG